MGMKLDICNLLWYNKVGQNEWRVFCCQQNPWYQADDAPRSDRLGNQLGARGFVVPTGGM